MAQLRYVVAAFQSGSFRRAADRLNAKQSSISRGIQALEHQLGVSLFERSPAGVRLTDAGRRFLANAFPALEQLEIAERLASAAGRAQVGTIRIGILTSLAGGFLRELLSRYSRKCPEVAIDVCDGGTDDHLAAIQQRRLDIAFLTGVIRSPHCEVAELWRERVHVALCKEHPLSCRRKLEWADLRNERFLVTRIAPGAEVYNYIIRRISTYSTYPKIEFRHVNRDTLLNLVSLGQGITLASAAWSEVKFPGLAIRPLTDDDILPFSAVWSAQNENPALNNFIRTAQELAYRVRNERPSCPENVAVYSRVIER